MPSLTRAECVSVSELKCGLRLSVQPEGRREREGEGWNGVEWGREGAYLDARWHVKHPLDPCCLCRVQLCGVR